MRITNSTLIRGYNRDLNRVLKLKNDSERRITSQRQFSRASESPLNAAKALNVRKSQYDSAQYQENLKVASKFYTEAETSLLQVSEQMASIRETIIAAVNTTKDPQDLSIYAQQLETKAKELCAIFNTESAGRVIFGGESNDSQPFEIINDANGNAATVTYHGIPINSMNDYTKFPYSKDVSVDIGLGMNTNQSTHVIDNDSVLKISFNGAEISGCGAECGVADVDLSSVTEGRYYSLYVYAGDVKKEINFKGMATQAENIAEINKQLKYEYRKEITYGRNYPEMDEQGVISLRNSMGDAVDGGIVAVINNPNAERTSQLKVDNDSNYTDKYRLSLSKLEEGVKYSVDVQVGSGEKKTITFEAGTDNLSDPNNPVFREDITVENFQKALDEAFGKNADGTRKVSISANDPTKGIISAEGSVVKLTECAGSSIVKADESQTYETADITKTSTRDITSSQSLSLYDLKQGETYSITATVDGEGTKEIVFTAGKTASDTKIAIAEAFDNAFVDTDKKPIGKLKIDNSGKFSYTKNGETAAKTVTLAETAAVAAGVKKIDLGKYTDYKIDLTALEDGKEYSLKVFLGTSMGEIKFTAGADETANQTALQDALDAEFGTDVITVKADGTFATDTGKSISVSNNVPDDGDNLIFEREANFSYNYVQLTLDAARALRDGNLSYANACIDRIVSASESLLVEIADLGCNEEFIDFNLSRLTIRDENLAERQNDLEIIDSAKEITLWKQYESMYNACLQMSSSSVPQSIFDYMS